MVEFSGFEPRTEALGAAAVAVAPVLVVGALLSAWRSARREERFRRLTAKLATELGDLRFQATELARAGSGVGKVFEAGVRLVQKAQWARAAAAFELGLETAGPAEQTELLNLAGVCHYLASQLNEAPSRLLKSASLARELGRPDAEAGALSNLGLVYLTRGEFGKSLEYHREALELDRKSGNRAGTAANLGRIGLACQALGDTEKALVCHSEALEVDQETGNLKGVASDLGRIGLVYQARGELETALAYCERALRAAFECRYLEGIADLTGNLGLIFERKGDADRALKYLLEALEVFLQVGGEGRIVATVSNIHGLYRRLGREEFVRACNRVGTRKRLRERLLGLMAKLDRKSAEKQAGAGEGGRPGASE